MRISDWSSDVCSSDLQQLTIDRADIGIGAHRSNRDLLAGGLRRQRVERLHLGAAIDAVRTKPHRDAARDRVDGIGLEGRDRSEEHTSELQSLMRISYAVFCLKKKKKTSHKQHYD